MFTGHPHYLASIDGYNLAKEMTALNFEDLSKRKTQNEIPSTFNKKGFVIGHVINR